jgi:hypothetical protein
MTAAPEPAQPREQDHPAQQPPGQADRGAWQADGESRYRRVAPGPAPDQPLQVRIEFVVLDGPAGKELARRQARIMRKVLRWIAEHPDPADP